MSRVEGVAKVSRRGRVVRADASSHLSENGYARVPREYLDALTPERMTEAWAKVVRQALEVGDQHLGTGTVLFPEEAEPKKAAIHAWLVSEGVTLPAPELAARLTWRIISDQVFEDCNHRTSWMLSHTLMEKAGLRFLPKPRKRKWVPDFIWSIDRFGSDVTVEETVAWFDQVFST